MTSKNIGPKMETMPAGSDLYRRMIDEIQDYAIILLDTHGIIRNWNKGAQQIKQYSELEIIGKHFSVFYTQHDLDNNLPQKLLAEARYEGRAAQEGWRKRKDGSRFWGSITITAIHDDEKNIIGFVKVTRDLTDKKAAEDSLRVSEERYHQMVAEVQDYAIILLSPDGTIENWNAGAENIKGYQRSEILGKKFELFYTVEDRESGLPLRLLDIARATGKATQEGWRVRKDGTRFWGSITITALHGKNNEVIGFSKVTRDLTQQKKAEEKLAANLAELERQNSELEQFAYVASHDLQEPLRKIQTFSELIKENFDDKDFTSRYLDKLDLSARRMSALIRSVLDYSRLANDKTGPTFTGVDLNDVVSEVMQDFERMIEEKDAVIVSGILPVVKGNPAQLGQLFSNLIGNSLKFSRTNPLIKISATVVHTDRISDMPKNLTGLQYHQIIIDDNGIGFEEQYSTKIFALFQRLHGKQAYTGTGIGLALCKKIAELHNGFVNAFGYPGKGASFHVYLPVTDESMNVGTP